MVSDAQGASFGAGNPPPTGRQAVWNYLVFGLSKSSTLIMTVVLARLLTPKDFGLFALALLIMNLFDWVKDLGVGGALVQSPRSWNRIAPTGLTLSVGFGVLAGGILAGTAGVVAGALNHPELAPLIRVLAVGLTISSLSAIPLARLTRSLDFRRRIVPDFLGATVKAAVAIGLAATGLGVWSLVYGQISAVIVITLLYWRVARTSFRFELNTREARQLISFGLPVTAVALLAYAIYNVDYLAIGLRLGDDQLGLYTLAYRLPELAVLNLCVVVSEVLFSSLSRLQHSRATLAEHYLRVVTAVMALTAPLGVALAVAAPATVETLYGPAYSGAAGALAVLALYTVLYSASFHTGDIYKAIGRPWLLTATSAGKLVVMVGPIWWAAHHSILRVAVVLLAVELMHFSVRMWLVQRVAEVSVPELGKALLRPLPATVCMAAVMVGTGKVAASLPDPVQLVLICLAGLPTYVAALRLTAPDLTGAAFAAVRSVRRKEKAQPPAAACENPSSADDLVGSVRLASKGKLP